MTHKILFIGNYTDEATYQLITQHDIRDLSQAARLFQQRLISSLSEHNEDFHAISILPTNDKTVLPESVTGRKTKAEVIPVVNGSVKSMVKAMKRIRELIVDDYGKNTSVLMYAVNPIALVPLLRLRREYKLTLITICTELPQFRRYRKTLTNVIKRRVLSILNQQFDKYIVFAEAMRNYLPQGRPYMLLEGFAPEKIQRPTARKENIAMYAGGLAEDNGIRMMIEAAQKSRLIDELWICGVGDCLEYVKSATDNKIKYLGRLTNSEVLRYEKQAKVLLNVRNPENDLTKFSFPSKILEYIAAGGIVVSSQLSGIPVEYYQYIELLKNYTVDDLATAMDKVFKLQDFEYLQLTERAASFIADKTAARQCRRINRFLLS